ARARQQRFPGFMLCGERDAVLPPGFEYRNSPEEFCRLELGGKGAILATSNGTRLLAAMAGAPAVLVGCLLNQRAVAEAAVPIAGERALDVAVLCSAAYGGSRLVLADGVGAGCVGDAVRVTGVPL